MRKQPSTLIVLKRRGRVSLQSQLVGNLKELVRTMILRPGEGVPSTRELARDLQISRNTVVQAYDRLVGEGYLEAHPRRGLFVSRSLAQTNLEISQPEAAANLPTAFPDSVGVALPRPFRPCQPDVRLFPIALWSRIHGRILRAGSPALLAYQSHLPLGLPALRKALADYLRESRGVKCDWRQIAITSGSQQALFLLAQLLLRPGLIVAMEDPGYPGARLAWNHAGARLRLASVDSEGMKLSLTDNCSTRLIYVTPSRQFPTGACLTLGRRIALVQFAGESKAFIIEDDYDSEFRYSRPPLQSLQSLDSFGRVIYVGSMSKVLFPSLRIGYVVLPVSLIEPFAALKSLADDHSPLLDQATLAQFIETGAFARYIRRCRREYGDRLQTFLESASKLGLPLKFPHTDGGMNVAGLLDRQADDREIAGRLQRIGLDIPAISSYAIKRVHPGLIFGFTAFSPATIKKSLEAAARVLVCPVQC
jgi:GntR family transcriptional regulator/MocR family aminotransferase